MALQLAHHQLHVDFLARYVPQTHRLANGHARVFLSMRDRQGHRDLLGVVQRRDALEEGAYFWVPLVAIFLTPLVASPIGGVLEERRPMGDAKVGQSACKFRGEVHEGGLTYICARLLVPSATCRVRRMKNVSHKPCSHLWWKKESNGCKEQGGEYEHDPPMTAIREPVSSVFIFWSMCSKRAPISLRHIPSIEAERNDEKDDRT